MGKSLSRLGSVLCGINRIVVNDGHYRHRRQLGEGAFRKWVYFETYFPSLS